MYATPIFIDSQVFKIDEKFCKTRRSKWMFDKMPASLELKSTVTPLKWLIWS